MLAEPSDRRQRDANTSQTHPTTRNMAAWIDSHSAAPHVELHVQMLRFDGSERTPTYKEKKLTQPDDINHGLLTYPVLQAADIVNLQGVAGCRSGKDQAAHLELSREIVRAFNKGYGETFPEPEAVFTQGAGGAGHRRRQEDVESRSATPSTSWASRRLIRKQVMSMDTYTQADPAHGSRPARGLQRLPVNPVLRGRLRGLSGTASARPAPGASTPRSCWPSGSSGTTTPARERYAELMAHPDDVDGILEAGADRLKPKAEATMAEVRARMCLRLRPDGLWLFGSHGSPGRPWRRSSGSPRTPTAGSRATATTRAPASGRRRRAPGGASRSSPPTPSTGRTLDNPGLDIAAVDTRRNVEVRGIDLEDLVGREFTVGHRALRRDPARGAVHLPRGPGRPADHSGADPQGRDPRRHPRGRRDRRRRRDRPGRRVAPAAEPATSH